MKKQYDELMLEVVRFAAEDVIATSGQEEDCGIEKCKFRAA